jgi:adenylate cyclase class IV
MRNLEAKFPLADIAATQQRAMAIGFEYVGTLVQHDTFFAAAHGKLKLREQPDGACLIHYQRHREKELEISDYEIVPISKPRELRGLLSAALGVLGEVHKRRILLRRTNIRLHLDVVDDHGMFGELEAVMGGAYSLVDSHAEIRATLAALQISQEQLIEVSYVELPR